ncbi:hypothetical protein SAMD00023353_5201020 [Rosellinia necatrix]|uniref:Uncharacterized protein n=1 Tax=Rosellinia necatrix TaxID=77044 RepID=A0A1W2TQM1_ROSNE|nr:hypothetical protein SAMD00023353_5201020 [Rosellinia necatrix]
MPPTKNGRQNLAGVSRQTADGVFYTNGRYVCRRLRDGVPCNREMADTRHSISSHNSYFHTAGRYQQLMALGHYHCTEDGCNHESPTFNAILGHLRSSHGFRGSSDPLKLHYGIPVPTKRKRKTEAKQNGRKKQRQDSGEGGGQNRLQEDEEGQENTPQDTEEDPEADDDLLYFIDPHLREWDRRHGGGGGGDFGGGGTGNGGSGLGGQILSSGVIAASS